jgi:hypothetical protein
MVPMADLYQEWLKANPAPNLVELISRYGSYDAVPVRAWAEFGDAQVEWEKRRKAAAQESKLA